MEKKDLGEFLYELRKQKGYTEQEIVEKIQDHRFTQKNVKKWERDLEMPDLNTIYKLSEIYQILPEEILYIKQETLRNGVNGIHKKLIRLISLMLGISIYSTIWISRVIMGITLIGTFLWFLAITRG